MKLDTELKLQEKCTNKTNGQVTDALIEYSFGKSSRNYLCAVLSVQSVAGIKKHSR